MPAKPAEPRGWEENPACRGKGLGEFPGPNATFQPQQAVPLLLGISQLHGTLKALRWSNQALPSFQDGEAQHRSWGGVIASSRV